MTATATASNITIADLRRYARAPKTAELIAAVLAARATAEETRARVDAYIAPVFARFTFTDKYTGERITKAKDLYLSGDEAGCAAFFAACDEAHKSAGYNLPAGYCPALVAETAAGAAEKALLKHGGEMLGIDFAGIWKPELRQKALDILMNHPERRG